MTTIFEESLLSQVFPVATQLPLRKSSPEVDQRLGGVIISLIWHGPSQLGAEPEE